MDDAIVIALREAAARIRDTVENKTPVPCNTAFMDADDQWRQIREWPTLGLVALNPHGR